MKNFSSLLGLLLFALSFANCSKKSDPDPGQTTTKTDQLTASAWKYDNAGVDQNKDGTIDIPLASIAPSVLLTCQTDNLLTFKKDNSGVVDEGATKCNAGDNPITTFNWSFTDNETNLTISNNVFAIMNGKSKIVSLTASNLALSKDTSLSGTPLTLVVTLKH